MSVRRPLGGFPETSEHVHLRIDANERVCGVRWGSLEFRLNRIEAALERLERRLWITVYGVAAAVLSHVVVSLVPGIGF